MGEADIIKAMDDHAKDFGIKVTTIGQLAVKSRHAYDRIKNGTAHRDTGRRIAEWLEADRASRAAAAPSTEAAPQ